MSSENFPTSFSLDDSKTIKKPIVKSITEDFATSFSLDDSTESRFQTVIGNHKGKIITFSDIHADMDALIISLRDCACVIRKKNESKKDSSKRDADLVNLLPLDLNKTKEYVDDLNYEWCGGNTIIVIIGDLLDGSREYRPTNANANVHYYPQVEVKILRFLNALHKSALSSGGKLIKLCGNHEILNFDNNNSDEYVKKYGFLQDHRGVYMTVNGRNYTRSNFFNYSNPGYDLYLDGGGTGVCLIVNNNIFVHGALTTKHTLSDLSKINRSINNRDLIDWEALMNRNEVDSPLLSRVWDDNISASSRMKRGDITICEDVHNKIKYFLSCNDKKASEYRAIVGHCAQNENYWEYFNLANNNNMANLYTFGTVHKNTNTLEFTNHTIHRGKMDFEHNIIYGITMDCIRNEQKLENTDGLYSSNAMYNNPQLVRVDCGISRGFDPICSAIDNKSLGLQNNCANIADIDGTTKTFIKVMYGTKTPQVFIIDYNEGKEYLKIIKSKLSNTKIHLPRSEFAGTSAENRSIAITQVNNYRKKNGQPVLVDPETLKDPYYIKYLKYKNKYLKLKNY